MTFEEYVLNPMGRNNAVLSAAARESQRRIYQSKFDNILLRENGKIDYFIYKGNDAVFYIHIKIPSEVVRDFYYDVVIKFTGSSASLLGLDKYDVQFYSNDPAFVYTYAHVFNTKGLFIRELAPKMSKRALKQPAHEKNPGNLVGYVKSLYFAYLFMKQRGLFNKLRFNGAPPINMKYLLSQIEDADTKIEKRQIEGEKVSQKKKVKVSRSTANKLQRIGIDDKAKDNLRVTTTKRVGVVKNKAGNVGKVKRTESTKRF